MKWFKHDSSAHIDAKLKKVRHKYGITGYGLYWYCIEVIALGVDAKNITFELEEDAETIAIEWGLDQLKVQEIMTYMCELGLFEANSGRVTCLKMLSRLDDTNSKNPEIKKILSKVNSSKTSKKVSDKVEDKPKESEQVGETPNDSAQKRLDKNRLEENRKDKKISAQKPLVPAAPKPKFTKPTLLQASEYFLELGSQVCNDDANAFIDHFDSNGWKVGGRSPMKDWKPAMRTWFRNSQKFGEAKNDEFKDQSKSISGRSAVTFTNPDF